VLKKYTMQMCSEMQCVKLNVQCPNNSYTQQTKICQSKLPKKTWIIKTSNNPSTNKHLGKKNPHFQV
jgi:hypothetical protein